MPVLEVVSPAAALANGVALDVMGSADLSVGAELGIRFTQGATTVGKVVRLEDSGARAVIEVDGKQWWLHRRNTLSIGGVRRHPWKVGGRKI